MIMEILKQFNWVDFLVVIILIRIIYIAFNNSFPAELLKLLGTVTGVYLSLHYFVTLVSWVRQRHETGARLQLVFFDFISFLVLGIIGYLIFVGLRVIFERFAKMEIHAGLNKILALILGSARSVLFAGLIMFCLVISGIGYLKVSVKDSYLGSRVFKVAPITYAWIWNNVTSKFSSDEEYNKAVPEIQREIK